MSKWTGVEDAEDVSVTFTREEALKFACLLPEIQALIKWAFNVRETMSDADLFVHGVEALKPFEGRDG